MKYCFYVFYFDFISNEQQHQTPPPPPPPPTTTTFTMTVPNTPEYHQHHLTGCMGLKNLTDHDPVVRRNTYTNQNVGCFYVGGTEGSLDLYYIPQALTSCPFGQMLQQGVYNLCVNSSVFAHNASYYLLCFKGRVPMAIHLVVP